MTKRAVVVGIDDYSIQGQPILNGCVRDARAFYHMLVDAFLFEPGNIYTYLDTAATSNAIRQALAYCVAQSEAGDVLCFYFSGHGGRLPHPTRAGEFYETIVPAAGQWISDHEMFVAADKLQPSFCNFTVVLDSCHSGGMNEETERAKAIKSVPFAQSLIDRIVAQMHTLIPCGLCLAPADRGACADNVSNVRAAADGTVDLDEDPNKTLIKQAKTTLIAGCKSTESSFCAPSGATIKNSLLTQGFLDIVNASNFEIDHHTLIQSLIDKVGGYMKKFYPSDTQTPQLRGQMNRMEETFLAGWHDSR
jgi:hypothetical protein